MVNLISLKLGLSLIEVNKAGISTILYPPPQVVYLLFNIASYYKCMLQIVDIRGAFLNTPYAHFTSDSKPIYLSINTDIFPLLILQDPSAVPYVTEKGQLFLLLERFLYGLKQSPLKFQLHLSRTLVDARYKQSINDEFLFYKSKGYKFSCVSTHSDDLLHCVNCSIMAHEFKYQLIKTSYLILIFNIMTKHRRILA